MTGPYTVSCTVKRLGPSEWLAQALGSDAGTVRVSGPTRQAALDGLQQELRYRMEWCPCSALADGDLRLVVTDLPPCPWTGRVW